MRRVLGIIAGVVAAFATVFAVESVGHIAFPPPTDTDLSDPAAMATLMDRIPVGAKLAVVVAWFLGAFAGAWTAVTIARWSPAGWIVVALVVAAGRHALPDSTPIVDADRGGGVAAAGRLDRAAASFTGANNR